MNSQEKMNALRQMLTLVFGVLAGVAPGFATQQEYSTLTTAIVTIVPALISLYSVCWSIYAHWNQKKVPETATALALPAPAPAAGAVVDLAPMKGLAKVVGALLACIVLLGALPALAASQPKLTGNPIADLNTAVRNQKAAAAATNTTCDFNTFVLITPQNVVSLLQACGERLLTDSQAALASATKAQDVTAIACLTPSVALAQAAVGTPAVAEVPATPTSPAVAAVPAQIAGPVLIFQKFREFVNNAGITNCKAWVNNTIAAAAAGGL